LPAVQFKYYPEAAYKKTWDLQESLLKKAVDIKLENKRKGLAIIPENHLIFCQHPHVYTLGKSGDAENMLWNQSQLETAGVQFYKINRGGDITYHGPGQLVGYPVLDLEQFFTDIHKYLRFLEEAIILTLAEYGIKAGRYEGYTGVWLEVGDPIKARKICAMGVRCSRWVTMHGFALNVSPDLTYFNHIVPCGIVDKKVTSMQQELGYKPLLEEVSEKVLRHLSLLFEMQIQRK